ncbi:TonB-dependent receptor [Thauera sp.]|uniref:TonB-dependent receptor n=1 Tax=Thauera sp. TaxID=1905334 RepID=UPI0039E63D73
MRNFQTSRPPVKLSRVAAAIGLCLASTASSAQDAAATLPTVTVQDSAYSPVKVDKAPSAKFTAPLIDTPKTVQVINEEIIKQTGATSLTEALRSSPGITFGSGEGGNPVGDRPFMRGSDTQNSIFVDGMRDIAASSREVYNLEAVEVIKGSDSAYGGRGGAGGSINLSTKKARNENFITGDVGLGTDNYKRATIDVNRMLSDTVGFRLNAMAHDADVPGRDGPENKRWGIAPTITFGMNTPTEVTLSYDHLQTDDMPDGGVPFAIGPTAGLTSPTTIRPTTGGDRENWYGLKHRDFRKEKGDTFTAAIEHKLSDTAKIRNATRYSQSTQKYVWTQPDDSQGNAANGRVWRRMNSRHSETDTLQNVTELTGEATTGSVKHQFAIGLELAREESDVDSYGQFDAAGVAIPNSNQCKAGGAPYMCTSLFSPNGSDPWGGHMVRSHKPTHYKTNTTSLYAFDTLTLTSEWLINAGIRVDDYRTRQWDATTRYSRKDTMFNYQLGVVYKLQPNASLYASIGTSSTPGNASNGQGSESMGIATGGGRSPTPNADDLKPEKTRSYEIGTKWDVLDNQLSLTAAIFRNVTTNARLRDSTTGLASMAGEKVVDGIELGFAGRLTRQWEVFGGYTYMDSEQKDIGKDALGRGNAGTGKAFPSTPEHSASLWTTYAFTPKFTVGVGAVGQSDVVGTYAYSTNRSLIKKGTSGYVRYDAMASYAFSPNLSLQINGYNLTDKLYYASTYSTHYATPAAGRSVVAALKFTY